MRGTYAERLPRLLREGRYHPHWKYTRTTSGRLAEEVITLIPKHSLEGLLIRNAFHAVDGNVLVLVDLSQIEMRVMAHESRDAILLGAYERGEDIHANTAHHLLGAPKGKENQDESKHRLPSKTINFGIINGMTEYGLLDQLHENGLLSWDIEQVRAFREGWFKLHSGVGAFWEGQKAKARKLGYVEDMFGRRRYLAGIHSTDERIVRESERQALHAIQSGADGISKLWNARIIDRVLRPRWREGRRYCEPWVRVHDETALEVDARMARTVRQEMLALVPQALCIPVTAEGVIEQRWGQHKLEKARGRRKVVDRRISRRIS
jgi:DNA polymerase-1